MRSTKQGHQTHSPDLDAEAALTTMKGEKTLAELGKLCDVHLSRLVLGPLAVATLLQRVSIEARDHPPTATEHAARHMIYPCLLLTPVLDQPDQV